MMESKGELRDLVIKVKYGDSLKRFTATITHQNSLNQTISMLRSKIISSFDFPPNAEFVLTYTDIDGDTVLLSDDDDLIDAAIKQHLNPLRIFVQLKSDGFGSSEARSGSSNLNPLVASLEEALKSLPAPLNNTVSKEPVLTELLNVFSKLAVPESQTLQPSNISNPKPPKVSLDPSKEIKKSGHKTKKRESSKATKGPYFHPPLTAPFHPFPSPQISPGPRTGINMMKVPNRHMEYNNNNNNNNDNMILYPDLYSKADERFTQPVHNGIVCDGCEITPIIGTRFKSIVKYDYDLCSTCFAHMGKEADYTRIEYSDIDKIIRDPSHQRYSGSSATCPMRGAKRSSKLESRFIQDITVLDWTLMAPLTPFTKIWRMRNNGSNVWPFGTQLVWVGGDQFSRQTSTQLKVPVTGFHVDQEIDIALDFCTPAKAGRYISYWRLASPSGQKFGQRIWVLIQVEEPNGNGKRVKAEINLNLPPESSMSEIMEVNVEPIVGNETAPKLINPIKNITYPVVDGPFSKHGKASLEEFFEYEPPIVQVLKQAVTEYTSSIVTQPAKPAVTQPDVPAVTQPEPVVNHPVSITVSETQPEPITVHHEPSPLKPYSLIDMSSLSSSSAPPLVEKRQVDDEETLLKELEQMGFKQVDLNKEVLRLNKYDLEQSVEDLCGFSEWDPLLEELNEMGFIDKEANKKLLVKNGGSIKRVVMDLIAGEKDKDE